MTWGIVKDLDDEPVIAMVGRWSGYAGLALTLGWALWMMTIALVVFALQAWE